MCAVVPPSEGLQSVWEATDAAEQAKPSCLCNPRLWQQGDYLDHQVYDPDSRAFRVMTSPLLEKTDISGHTHFAFNKYLFSM